jgi:hypothetical protein
MWMPKSWDELFRADHRTFYCINGHAQCYSQQPSEASRLRQQLEEERRLRQRAEQNIAMWRDDANEARKQAEHQRARANGYKGFASRITKRAKAGLCPCCNRSFVKLAQHMATKHPEFTPDVPEPEKAQ